MFPRPPLRHLLPTAPVAALALALQMSTALAAETLPFDIPAQPLSSALRALATQAGVQLVFTPETTASARAPALKGALSVDAALEQLLQGSGLVFQRQGPRSYVVIRSNPAVAEGLQSEVVVTATRLERPVDEVPASVSVLTARSLATKSRQNVYEALKDFEGLDFVNQPGVGHQVFPTIRGVGGSFAGSTTQVLVDGMAHDSVVSSVMGHGGLNFTSLLDVERVEVVRGPASALYGPSAVGGVINVIPKRWKDGPGGEILASFGSHNTRILGVAVGAANDQFDVRLSIHDARSDGYKAAPVEDPNGGWDLGPRNWNDKKIGLMLGLRPTVHQEITFDYQQYAIQSASYGGRPNAGQHMNGQSSTLGYRIDLSADTTLKAHLRSTHLIQDYDFDNWDWNGLATPGTVAAGDLNLAYFGGRKSDSTAFQAVLETRPMDGNQLIVGYGHDTGEHSSYGTTVGGSGSTSRNGSKSTVDALFVQDEHRFGALSLIGGARYDRIDLAPDTVNGTPKNGSASVADVVNPRLGARYHLNEATSVYASYGTAYLPATNTFKYVQPSTTRVDNPDLKPERSTTVEIGMNNRWRTGTLRTALFHTDYEDKIALGTDTVSGKRQWQNIAQVKVDGVELAYQGSLPHGWLPYANFSYTKARDHATSGAPGTESLRVAPRKFNAGITYAPGERWAATLNARYVSGLHFNSLSDAQWADSYTQVDAKLSTRLPLEGHKLDVFLAVNNLTDKKFEAFNKGEWTDGRTYTVGLSGRF